LTTKNVYDICSPYIGEYFRSLLYDISQLRSKQPTYKKLTISVW